MKLEQDKEEIDKQLRQTQEAVLAGKQRVEQLREEVQKRTEARTVSAAINLMSATGVHLCIVASTTVMLSCCTQCCTRLVVEQQLCVT